MSTPHALAFLVLLLSSCAAGARSTPRGVDAVRACTTDDECVVVPRTCCGRCGAATRDDSMAINARWLAEHHGYPCEDRELGCPDCYEHSDPSLSAGCRGGTCVVLGAER
jgi:hypothetical protein